MGILDESGLDTLDMFIEFLKAGRPGTKVVVAEFRNGIFKEDIVKAGRQMRDCKYSIAAYLHNNEVGVLVREDVVDTFRNVAEKGCGNTADYQVYDPNKFLDKKKNQ